MRDRRETMYIPPTSSFTIQSEDEHDDDDDEEEIPMEMDLTAAGPPTSDDETDINLQKPIEDTWQEHAVVYAKMILPHVGLVVLLIVYLLFGATVFHHLEWDHEKETKERELNMIFGLRNQFLENIWNLTDGGEVVISREAYNKVGQEYFEKLVEAMFDAYRNQFITEKHLMNKTQGDEMMWTYANSIFFATTVITTIGYGNLVPTTFWGRMFCIVFALFGIPLLLVTIADIGKFLSDFLSFIYRTYRAFKRKLRKQSRRISQHYRERSTSQSRSSSPDKQSTLNLDDMDDGESESSAEDELRIPVIMVMLVLIAYTALGGLLFRSWEGWNYFDAFYFCFITMATVGFGDFVPTEQVYMFFTMAYIIFGLSLATMCIDLAGTEYIRKIHYLGTKMEDAKGAMMTGLHAGEHLLKHTGIGVIRTAGGKLIQVRGAVLNSRTAREFGMPEFILGDLEYERNILYEPLSPAVQRLVREQGIKVMPDEITEADGYIVRNKTYDKPPKKQYRVVYQSPNAISRRVVPASWSRGEVHPTYVVPFVLKESDV